MQNEQCRNCSGCGWVCENHRDTPWAGLVDGPECCGGAGSPCPVCNPEMACAGYVSRALEAAQAPNEEVLAEALFNLSARLKDAGFLDDDANHAAYEAVVAAFSALTTPTRIEAAQQEVGNDALEAMKRVNSWLCTVAECDMDELVADGGITAAMVVQQEAKEQQKRMRTAIAAALTTQPQAGEAVEITDALRAAYEQGATDVHNEWLRAHENGEGPPRGDPEFGEAASDYAASVNDPFSSEAPLYVTTPTRIEASQAPVQTEAEGSLREQAEAMKAIGAHSMLVPIDSILSTPPQAAESDLPPGFVTLDKFLDDVMREEAAESGLLEKIARAIAGAIAKRHGHALEDWLNEQRYDEAGAVLKLQQGGWPLVTTSAGIPDGDCMPSRLAAAESGLLEEALEVLRQIAKPVHTTNSWFQSLQARIDMAQAFLAKAGKPGEAGNGPG